MIMAARGRLPADAPDYGSPPKPMVPMANQPSYGEYYSAVG